jgi:hypothetical protein
MRYEGYEVRNTAISYNIRFVDIRSSYFPLSRIPCTVYLKPFFLIPFSLNFFSSTHK